MIGQLSILNLIAIAIKLWTAGVLVKHRDTPCSHLLHGERHHEQEIHQVFFSIFIVFGDLLHKTLFLCKRDSCIWCHFVWRLWMIFQIPIIRVATYIIFSRTRQTCQRTHFPILDHLLHLSKMDYFCLASLSVLSEIKPRSLHKIYVNPT